MYIFNTVSRISEISSTFLPRLCSIRLYFCQSNIVFERYLIVLICMFMISSEIMYVFMHLLAFQEHSVSCLFLFIHYLVV